MADYRAILLGAELGLKATSRKDTQDALEGLGVPSSDVDAGLLAYDQAMLQTQLHAKNVAQRDLVQLQIQALVAGQTAPVELAVRDPRALPPGWKPAGLCLQGCGVQSNGHPGLHKCLTPGDKGEPVCALPAGHPGGDHYCKPSDQTRYARCPTCNRLVPKRSVAGHVKAHDPANRHSREALKELAKTDVARYLRSFCAQHPELEPLNLWGNSLAAYLENAAWHVEAGRWNPTGYWLKARLNDANVRILDWWRTLRQGDPTLPEQPPQLVHGLRAIRKALEAKP
jgi:hypothetical protein